MTVLQATRTIAHTSREFQRRYWSLILLGVVVVPLVFYNLEYYPHTWFDEGCHLLAARALALQGRYAFGPAVGPTLFFPIAAMFRLAGVGILQARIVMAGYLLLTAITFYALVRYLYGPSTAFVALLFLISSPGIHFLRWGRQALGEVPAMFFLLVGVWTWFQAVERRAGWLRLITTGVFFGLAILTKNQFLLLVPAWLLLWILNHFYYRQANHRSFLIPLLFAICVIGGWYFAQWSLFPIGPRLAAGNVEAWSSSTSRGILTFSSRRLLDSIKFLTGQDVFYAWLIPGWVYAVMLSLRRDRYGLFQAFLTLLVTIWLGWFVLLSVGWRRYAFAPLVISAIFVARLFHDLTAGFRADFGALRGLLQGKEQALILAMRMVILILLAVIILRPLQGRFAEVIGQGSSAPQDMAAYIEANVPPEANIETWEPEIIFLTNRQFHHPPSTAMDAAIKYAWYSAPPPSEYYDFQKYNTQYLLIGEFGRWAHIYAPEIVEKHYDLVVSLNGYELYKERAE
ncbi:MAG: glycosyltransferase family 39 protein [Anaerolineae bacterium]|nr:glycosyltransferase family 39 protein [Anaerolineae bacterium]